MGQAVNKDNTHEEVVLPPKTVVDIYNAEKDIWELAGGRVLKSGRETFRSDIRYRLEVGPNWQEQRDFNTLDVRKHIVINLEYPQSEGVVVPWPTGISITSQTGGGLCCHPMIEGFFIHANLFSEHDSDDQEALHMLLDKSMPYDGKLVAAFLAAAELDDVFEPVPQERQGELLRLGAKDTLQEAWVGVLVRTPGSKRAPGLDPEDADEDEPDADAASFGVYYEVFAQFSGRLVYITYSNSD